MSNEPQPGGQITLVWRVEDLPEVAPPEEQLRATGLTLVSYAAVDLPEGFWAQSFDADDHSEDDRGYLSKLAAPLRYLRLASPRATDVVADLAGGCRIAPYILASSDAPLGLMIVTGVFDYWGDVDRAVSTDTILDLLARWTSTAVIDHADAVAGSCLERAPQVRSPIRDVAGVQIWGLASHEDPASPAFDLEEARRHLWEASAILQFTSDHIVKDQLWQRQSPLQVLQVAGKGSTYLGDHIVFTTKNCCLEISHLGVAARRRSTFRLDKFGYDSTSIFVWSSTLYRRLVLERLSEKYRSMYRSYAFGSGNAHADDLPGISRGIARDQLVIDGVRDLAQEFVEQRHFLLAERLLSLDRSEELLRRIDVDTDRIAQAIQEVYASQRERAQNRTNLLLTVVTVLIAALGIPATVVAVGDMIRAREWAEIAVTSAGALVVLAYLAIRLLRSRIDARTR